MTSGTAQIAEARRGAAIARQRTVDVLEERLGLDPDAFTAELGATLRVECPRMDELRLATPAFDLLPLAECSQHGCALVCAAGGRLLLAFDDPYQRNSRPGRRSESAEPFGWCLVHRGDLVAFLAAQEEALRGLDAVQVEATAGPQEHAPVKDLSLKTIGDESSEVVRLVRSTLRDTLMIGASDVHRPARD